MTTDPKITSPLIDVTHLSVSDLLASGDTNLAACIERILTSLDDPDGIISAFQSFASDS